MTATTATNVIGRSRRIPGEAGIWVLICGDLIVFSIFFIVFMKAYGENTAVFVEAQSHLNQVLGLTNTLLMLTSSWFVAMAVQSARKNLKTTPLLFWLALLCGLGFAVVKFFEYRAKIRAGFGFNTNDFFMYYYVFTGIHLMHVYIGMGVLALLAMYCRSGTLDAHKLRNMESGACFWHLVDLLWIVLFPLVYLVK